MKDAIDCLVLVNLCLLALLQLGYVTQRLAGLAGRRRGAVVAPQEKAVHERARVGQITD